jgi:phosphoribosyl-ATP pyrophosphohydrolase/phosphoribosyl-AMP cyclohydrolase
VKAGLRAADPRALRWPGEGLLPVVVQEVASGAVLMVAWADRAALARTLESGDAWFWSRSRRSLWRKGETSGNVLRVVEVASDCDGDALLYRVDPAGPTCHTGARSCFERLPGEAGAGPAGPRLELGWLWQVLAERASAPPAESYTARLLAAGIDRVARKVGEEATEVVIAALRSAGPEPAAGLPSGAAPPLVEEAADLVYHLLVLLLAAGEPPERVAAELRRRHARPRTQVSPKPEGPG